MALTVGSRLGHYDVTALIGEGGMGQVWQATDTQLNRQVALKILPDAFAADPERLARFTREAQILASLNHPNIAAIHGIEEAEGTQALVLELVEGPTLADRIAKGPIPLDEALPIAKQIAEALEAAHEAGVIHRDLKPANIKMREDGTVKVLDFGLAKRLPKRGTAESQATMRDALTRAGAVLGTPAYMSPEQILGQEADARSDIFSFGVVLYEVLAGVHPFLKGTTSDTMAAIVRAPPTRPSGGADPATDALFDRMLAKEPGARYQTVEEVCAEIRRLKEVCAIAAADAASTSVVGRRRTQYVGRETERAELERLVHETIRGRGGIVLIGGEPGVGKTRLAEALERTAGDAVDDASDLAHHFYQAGAHTDPDKTGVFWRARSWANLREGLCEDQLLCIPAFGAGRWRPSVTPEVIGPRRPSHVQTDSEVARTSRSRAIHQGAV